MSCTAIRGRRTPSGGRRMSRTACTRRASLSGRCTRSMAAAVSCVVTMLHIEVRTLYFVCGAVVSLRSALMLAAVGGVAILRQPSASRLPSACSANIPDAIVCVWCGGVGEEHCLEIAPGARVNFWRCHPSTSTCVLGFPESPSERLWALILQGSVTGSPLRRANTPPSLTKTFSQTINPRHTPASVS